MYKFLGILGLFDVFDSVVDWFESAFDSIADAIGSAILDAIKEGIGWVCYYLTCAWCDIIKAAYAVFAVFAGISKVQMKEDFTYLTNLFFENEAINGIYWGMVMIGAVLAVVFTIIAVVRKMFDINDKQQQSLGQVIGGLLKSLFVMITLTAVMSVAMSFTNILVERVSYVFDQNKSLTERSSIEFSDDEFAAMARIFNTIGNYSLNPSYNQRFNLNSCYNELRPDLLYLQQKGVFDLVYPTKDENGNDAPTWQSELEQLVYAASPEKELDLDLYYVESSNVLIRIMNTLHTNADFRPLESFKKEYTTADSASLDRVVFLMGTMKAAKNDAYNRDPAITDGLRGAFYMGEKSIYSLSDVKSAFHYQLGGISYIMIWFVGYWVLKNLYRCILNCCTRLVNIVGLYLIAPPIAATMSLDDGRRFKEWTTSMIIQVLGVFGNIIPMRLIILFIPMVLDSDLVLLPSTILNVAAKALLIAGMLEGVSRFSGILTGILANNAGFAAIQASNTNDLADKQFGRHFGKHFGGEDPDDPLGEKKQAKKDRANDKKDQKKKEELAKKAGAAYGGAAGAAVAGAAAKKAGEGGKSGGDNKSGEGNLPANQQGKNESTESKDTQNQNGTNNNTQTNSNGTNSENLPQNQQGQGQGEGEGQGEGDNTNANNAEGNNNLPNNEGTNVNANGEGGGNGQNGGGNGNGEQPLPGNQQNQQGEDLGHNEQGEPYVGKDEMGIPYTQAEKTARDTAERKRAERKQQKKLDELGKNANGEQYVGRDIFGRKYTQADNDAHKKSHNGRGIGGEYYGNGFVESEMNKQNKRATSAPPKKEGQNGNQGGGNAGGGNVGGGNKAGGNVGGGNVGGGNVGGGNVGGGNVGGGNVGGGNVGGGNVGGGNVGGGNVGGGNQGGNRAGGGNLNQNNGQQNNAQNNNGQRNNAQNNNVQQNNANANVPKKKAPPKDPLSKMRDNYYRENKLPNPYAEKPKPASGNGNNQLPGNQNKK